jgi:hypothetical protein
VEQRVVNHLGKRFKRDSVVHEAPLKIPSAGEVKIEKPSP